MNRFWVFAAAIYGAIASGAAVSADAAPAGANVQPGNAQQGQTKAVVCAACHGQNGNSTNPDYPSLAGLGSGYIVEQLQNFKSGARNNPIMAGMVQSLSAQDMADIGAYYDTLVNTGLEADPSYWQAGEKLYRGGDKERGIPACMACHGPTGAGNEPAKFPALKGEQSVYIVKQLTAYAAGTRPPGPGGIMPVIAKRLSQEDIRNLASYVQGLR
jgi:cytochrome c553